MCLVCHLQRGRPVAQIIKTKKLLLTTSQDGSEYFTASLSTSDNSYVKREKILHIALRYEKVVLN